jgi:protein gp37
MSATTKIQWTDRTWNPVRGCSLVSAGCANCYAMKQAHRFSGMGRPYENLTEVGPKGPRWNGNIMLVPEALEEPLRWKTPARVFVNSMSDIFHEDVPDEFIDKVFAVMALTSQHTYQLLSKRPERMRRYVSDEGRSDSIVREVWRIRNRQRRTDLEASASRRDATDQGGQRIHQSGRRKTVRTSESRIQDAERLFAGFNHDRRGQDGDRSSPDCVGTPQRADSRKLNDQSQEWNQDGQPSREPGISDLFAEPSPCPGSFECESESPQGIASSENKDNGERSTRNQETQERWANDQGNCGEICNEKEGYIGDLQSENVEAHLEWPLPNVWLGVSIENQETADERVPLLLQTPAAVRFISVEPLLGPVDLTMALEPFHSHDPMLNRNQSPIDWIIAGGESGPGARPCDVAWIRAIKEQCQSAGVPVFVKQLGSKPFSEPDRIIHRKSTQKLSNGFYRFLTDGKGGDWNEWPEDLKVREFPTKGARNE